LTSCPACAAENDTRASRCVACGAALANAPDSLVVSVDLRAGTLFHSRYEILGPLGRGGMGMVYKARDRTLDEIVAIKVLRPDIADDRRMAQRFKAEIKLARRVRHRNVCAIHDFGEEQGLLFISMEFIDGVDLKRLVKERGPLPAAQAFDVTIQVADALQAVHDAGIIHRDLKTPNIMLDGHGVARLMDFGVAKHEDMESATGTGHVVGTPDYMSPEQAQAAKVDHRCDLYALGIVAFEIFTGRVPFKGDTPLSTLLKHVHEAPPLDGAAAFGLPQELRPVLAKALSKDPAQRYASAREMADAVRIAQRRGAQPSTLTEGETVAQLRPLPPTLLDTPVPTARPRRSWLVAVVAGGLAISALVAHLALRGGSPPDPSPPPPLPTTTTLASAAPTPVTTPAPQPTEQPVTTTLPPPARTPRPTPPPTPRATATPAPETRTPGVATEPKPAPPSAAPEPRPAPIADDRTGLLQIAVRPWGVVTVDGRLLGQTPLDRISLTVGSHAVRVEHPAYAPLDGQVTIRPGETSKLSFDFAKDGARR